MDHLMLLEQTYLEKAIISINSEIKRRALELEMLPKHHGTDPFLLETLMSIAATRHKRLLDIIDKPYFARIDFIPDDKTESKECYIGKSSVIDEHGNSVVIDWRSPICTLYYDSNLGKVSYVAPMGTIEGKLLLKRQFVIEKQNIESIYDVDSVSEDELLKPYLKANADTRLKNIVASIQKEQNQIIRSSIHNNMIVEGVAGSGKTTVALHRIAYLVYNETDRLKPTQFMVIGPNKFFINYISSVLPDLESGDVKQLTLEGVVESYLNETLNYCSHIPKLIDYISGKKDSGVSSLKQSLKYKEMLDEFVNNWEKKILSKDLTIEDVKIKSIVLREEYNRYSNISIKEKIDHAIRGLSKKIKHVYPILNNKDINSALKSYFKMPSRIITLYKEFVTETPNLGDTLINLNKNKVSFEDLGALMYLKYHYYGADKLKSYAHIVIDEAQDLGVFQFYVLKLLFKRATFTIFGDIAQAIYGYRSIESFEEVKDNVFGKKIESLKLIKSYRTTVEIMGSANKITSSIGLSTAMPVIRHGKEVLVSKRINIPDKIREWQINNYKTMAIICKDDEECKIVHKILNDAHIESELITYDKTEYNGGICVLTSYLAKGLEFDCVIIYNAGEEVYHHDNIIDMKLLYVAMTRALHELVIIYNGNLTKYLS